MRIRYYRTNFKIQMVITVSSRLKINRSLICIYLILIIYICFGLFCKSILIFQEYYNFYPIAILLWMGSPYSPNRQYTLLYIIHTHINVHISFAEIISLTLFVYFYLFGACFRGVVERHPRNLLIFLSIIKGFDWLVKSR